MNYQKIFKYQFQNNFNEYNFFINETNYDAFNGIITSNANRSFLYGAKKSGKTFIGQIWLKKNNGIKFADNFDYIINRNINILIDNLENFNQEQIFHLINNCILNNIKILITSNKKINEIKFNFEDLPSRLKTFNNFEIKIPNDEMLSNILTKLLIDKQFIIKNHEIFEYILRRVDRSYQGIHDIVTKLDSISLQKKRQLTIPLIKEIL